MDERSAYMILRSLAQTGAGMTQPGDYGYDVGQQAVQQADAGLEEVARKEHEKKQKEAKRGGVLGQVGGIIGTAAGSMIPGVGPIVGPAIGGALGTTAGVMAGGGQPDYTSIALNSALGPAMDAGFDYVGSKLNAQADRALESGGEQAAAKWNKASVALDRAQPQLSSLMGQLPIVEQPSWDTTGLPAERASALRQEYAQQDVVNRRMQQDIDEAARLDQYRQGELAIRRDENARQGRRDQAYIDSLSQPDYTRIPEITYNESGAPMQPMIRTQPGQSPEIMTIPIPGTIPQKKQQERLVQMGGVTIPENVAQGLAIGDPDAKAYYDTLQQQLPIKPQKPEMPIMVQTPKGQVPMLRSQLPIGQPVPGTAPELKPETVVADRVSTAVINRFKDDSTITPEDKGMLETYTYNVAMKIMEGGQDPGIPTFEFLGQAPVPPDNSLKNVFQIIFFPSGAQEPVVEKVAFDIDETAASEGLQEAPK